MQRRQQKQQAGSHGSLMNLAWNYIPSTCSILLGTQSDPFTMDEGSLADMNSKKGAQWVAAVEVSYMQHTASHTGEPLNCGSATSLG